MTTCPVCKNEFEAKKRGQKTCSVTCRNLSYRQVVRPDHVTLRAEVELLGVEGTARKYGVSGTAVRQWLGYFKKPSLK